MIGVRCHCSTLCELDLTIYSSGRMLCLAERAGGSCGTGAARGWREGSQQDSSLDNLSTKETFEVCLRSNWFQQGSSAGRSLLSLVPFVEKSG